jgi:hypothetical protein
MADIELTKCYVRHREGYPETEIMDSVRRGMWALNVETAIYEWVDDIDVMEDLGPEVGVAGYVGDVWQALKKLGKPRPEPLDYPERLEDYFGRGIWKSTLGEVRAFVQPLFVKPLVQKEFNGFVWRADHESRRRVVQHGDETGVWCSEVVEFVSEYRACILYRKLVGLQRYKGDFFKVPDQKVVEGAIKAMGRHAPHAYCLDFGVTEDGRTLLVEATEGFSFGPYGLNPVTHARMIAARWNELASD